MGRSLTREWRTSVGNLVPNNRVRITTKNEEVKKIDGVKREKHQRYTAIGSETREAYSANPRYYYGWLCRYTYLLRVDSIGVIARYPADRTTVAARLFSVVNQEATVTFSDVVEITVNEANWQVSWLYLLRKLVDFSVIRSVRCREQPEINN